MERKHVVMVVDDEEDLRDMMAFQLKSAGYEVVTACDGLDALSKLQDVSPSLIVLDLNMPRMGGIEMYQRLCENDGKPSCPVLVLTARANTEQLFKELDVDGFMTKPFEIGDLIKEVKIIIDKHSRVEAEKDELGPVKSIYLVEDDKTERDAIALCLLDAGYRVAVAKSGTAMLELMAAEPPVLALIKLGLPDLTGDIVVLKASQMAKTSRVKFVLYEARDSRHLQAVRERIGDKTGVLDFVEFASPSDLLKAADTAIQPGGE